MNNIVSLPFHAFVSPKHPASATLESARKKAAACFFQSVLRNWVIRRKSLWAGCAGDACHAGRFFAGATVPLGGLLIIAVPLDIADEALFFAHFLKPLDHLLDAFAGS